MMLSIWRTVVLFWVTCGVVAVPSSGRGQDKELMKETDSAKLVAVLRSDAPLFDKAKACQRLAVVGQKDAIPVLAGLLGDEQLAHYARFGLEANPDPAVDEALRAALPKLKGKLLVGVINSIGFRRDAGGADAVAPRLKDSDVAVAAAAAAALGRIATPSAAKALQQALAGSSAELRPFVADACLTLAERLAIQGHAGDAKDIYHSLRRADVPKHHKLAATRWAIVVQQKAGVPLLVEQLRSQDDAFFAVALRASHDLPGAEVTEALAAELEGMPVARQVRLIAVLGNRRDAAAAPAVLKAAKSGSPECRAAAIGALAKLGDASSATVLLEAAFSGEKIAAGARDALATLPGKEVDAAIVAKLGAADAKVRCVAIELAGLRRIASAVPALRKGADDGDEQVRAAALKALGLTADPSDLSVFTARLLKPKSPVEAAAAQEALTAACLRSSDREATAAKLIASLPQASAETRDFLYELLGRVGGVNALAAVTAAAKASDPAVQDTGTRVLGEWMSPDAAPVLLDLAKTAADSKYKIRALRGYIRIARQLKLPAAERIAMCKEALAAASRDDEKKLVLDVLGRNVSPQSLGLIVDQLTIRTLKGPAAAAAVKMAEKMVASNPQAVADAMQKVLDARVRGQVDRAEALLKQAKQSK